MTRVRKLYQQWYKQHKHFFSRKSLKEDCLEEAKQSLLHHLRKNNVSLTDTNFTITEYSFAWELCMYAVSLITGAIGGSVLSSNHDASEINLLFILSFSVSAICFIVWLIHFIRRNAKAYTLSGTSLLQITLQEYKEMYGDAINTTEKLVQLYTGHWISIPCNAAALYDGQSQQPEYYNHALLVNVKHHDMTFKYVWFTNTNYPLFHPHTLYRFIDVCAQQIGHNWAPSSANTITLEKLQCNDSTRD